LGSAAAWPLVATKQIEAQERTKIPRVGVLTPAESDTTPGFDAFRKGLRDLGYVEGKSIVLDFRFAKGHTDELPRLAAE
jgi:putative ABC transport system substrate-binding protein